MHRREHRRPLVPALATALLAALAGCGASVASGDGAVPADGAAPVDAITPGDAAVRVPRQHRAAAVACTRPPPLPADAGPGNDAGPLDAGTMPMCTSVADCTARPGGHCVGTRFGMICTYDGCYADGECATGSLCACGGGVFTNAGANVCLPGNCRTDGDCGPSGYCSPTFNTTCGAYSGVVGYYCHTARDACTDDEDCVMAGRPNGYCAYQPATGAWACGYGQCVGRRAPARRDPVTRTAGGSPARGTARGA